jgi:hypothetical protein
MSERGSARMLARWFGEPTVVEEEDLKRVLELAQFDGVESFEWFPFGIPAQQIDGVFGVVRVVPETAPQVVTRFLEMGNIWRHLDLFPIGIPFPDIIEIGFGAQGEIRATELPGG